MRILRDASLVLLVVMLVLGPVQPEAQAGPPAFRYTLADGTVLVGVPLADEHGMLTIQTSLGVIRVPKSSIRTIELADAPGGTAQPTPAPMPGPVPGPMPAPMPGPMPGSTHAPMPAPAAGPTMVPTVVIENSPPRRRKSTPLIASGAGTFAAFWFASAVTASVAIMSDPGEQDALLGFVPVAGPIVWAAKADNQPGLGLAIMGGIFQAGGLFTLGTGAILRASESQPAPQRMLVSPNVGGGMDRGGISVSVRF